MPFTYVIIQVQASCTGILKKGALINSLRADTTDTYIRNIWKTDKDGLANLKVCRKILCFESFLSNLSVPCLLARALG